MSNHGRGTWIQTALILCFNVETLSLIFYSDRTKEVTNQHIYKLFDFNYVCMVAEEGMRLMP